MPRTNSGAEVLTRVTAVYKLIIQPTSPFDQTTSSALVKGTSTTVTVGATTNATAGDIVAVVGSGGTELLKIGTPATTMPLSLKPAFAHNSGARLVEMQLIDLGHIDESAVSFTSSLDVTPVNAATSRIPLAYIYGQGKLGLSFNLRGFNNPNIATIMGQDEAEFGTGTSADPFSDGFSGTTIGTHGLQCYRVLCLLSDGRTVQLDFNGSTVAPNTNTQVGGGSGAALGLSLECTNFVPRIWT